MLSQAMAQRIEHWKLADLTPYPRNPRRHSDAQIAGSIAQFGFNSPIPIDSKGSIIPGHGRYLASVKLDLDKCRDCPRSPQRNREARLSVADNKLAELSSFDDEILRSELTELRNAELDSAGWASATTSFACCWRILKSQMPTRLRKRRSRRRPPSRLRAPAISGASLDIV